MVKASTATGEADTRTLRVMMSRKAPHAVASTGRMAAQWIALPVGRSMIRMPAKPTKTALQRRQPTFSPSIGVASAVTKSGPEKAMAMQSASGR